MHRLVHLLSQTRFVDIVPVIERGGQRVTTLTLFKLASGITSCWGVGVWVAITASVPFLTPYLDLKMIND